jgi:hypothetical protein
MNKALNNFWLNVALYILLVANIALVVLTPAVTTGSRPGFGWHLHAVLGILMTVGCLMHIGMHWQWFQAVLTGKAKGRIKLVMISMVTVMMVLASLSGHEVMTATSAGGSHRFTGSLALIGLFIHSVKRIRWMALTARRFVSGGQEGTVIQSA